jgi:hypothetical protein
MFTTLERYDPLMDRLLWVRPQPVPSTGAGRPLGLALAISATRCTIQYIVLPLLLPVIGLAGGYSLGVVLILDLIALVAVVTSLRRVWRTRWAGRWRYLPLAGLALFMIGAFLALDLGLL